MDKLKVPEIHSKNLPASKKASDDFLIEKRGSPNKKNEELGEIGTAMAYIASDVVESKKSKKIMELNKSVEIILTDSDEESRTSKKRIDDQLRDV